MKRSRPVLFMGDPENFFLKVGSSNSAKSFKRGAVNSMRGIKCFSDVDDASSSQNWYHYVWDYAVETHYSVNTINDFTCDFNRGDPVNDLFIFNHFVTDATLGYGLYNESNDVNANPFFITRALDCQTQTNKFPNFVTVDYYELGDGLAVVDQLNGITTSAINISEQEPERRLSTIRDILGQETESKNNSILFYLYDNGTVDKKIIIE